MSYYEGEQRRAAPRVALQVPIAITDPKGNLYVGQTIDISNRGLGASLESVLPERADYHIALTLPAHGKTPATPMEFHAFIIYCTTDPKQPHRLKTGGYFSQISEHDRHLLDAFLLDRQG